MAVTVIPAKLNNRLSPQPSTPSYRLSPPKQKRYTAKPLIRKPRRRPDVIDVSLGNPSEPSLTEETPLNTTRPKQTMRKTRRKPLPNYPLKPVRTKPLREPRPSTKPRNKKNRVISRNTPLESNRLEAKQGSKNKTNTPLNSSKIHSPCD